MDKVSFSREAHLLADIGGTNARLALARHLAALDTEQRHAQH
jgi:glucokinase